MIEIPNVTLGFADACIYCGVNCIPEMDHVIPYSYISSSFSKHRKPKDNKRGIRISSCAECNRSLNNYISWNFLDRFEEARKRVAKKYKKELATPFWSEREIKELDYSLSTLVREKLERKRYATSLINWTGTKRFQKAVQVLRSQCKKKNCLFTSDVFETFFQRYDHSSL